MSAKPSLLERLWLFLVKPELTLPIPKQPFLLKFWDSLRLFCFFFIFSILGVIINLLVTPFFGDGVENQVADIVSDIEANRWLAVVILFFLFVVFAPIIEEIAFRQWLVPTRWNLALGLTFLLYYLEALLSSVKPWLSLSNLLQISFDIVIARFPLQTEGLAVLVEALRSLFVLFGYMGIFVVFLLGLYLILRTHENLYLTIKQKFQSYFGLLFYFSAVFFGLIHITNYANIQQLWWLTPLLVLPQLFGGLELGYIRVQYGLFWAMFNHALNNFIPFVATASLLFLPKEVFGGSVSVAEANLSDGDTLVLAFLGLFFITLFIVVVLVNLFNVLELIFSLLRKNQLRVSNTESAMSMNMPNS